MKVRKRSFFVQIHHPTDLSPLGGNKGFLIEDGKPRKEGGDTEKSREKEVMRREMTAGNGKGFYSAFVE